MTTVDAGGQTFDMTAIDLSDFGGGTVTASSATEVDVTGEGGTLFYKIIGTGLGDFDVNGFPHSGTITGFDLGPSHGVPSSFSGLSMSASTFMGFVSDDDLTGFETAALSGADHLTGYRGNDVLIGGGGNDIFGLSKGGDDTVSGGAGNDYFSFGAAFTGADSVDGGDGSDKIALNGDYSAGVTLGTSTLTSVESIVVSAGHSYSLTTVDANVASGAILSVNASLLGAGNTLTFDGSAEADGVFHLTGGAGNDVLTGGAGADSFILNKGGNDTVNGGGGNDYINFDTAFTAADTVNGGAGSDRIVLAGNYASGVTLNATTLTSVETVVVDDGHSYKLIFNDGNVAAGQTMSVNGSLLTGTHTLYADGSAETDGQFHLTGGAGSDTLIGGAGNDVMTGGDGDDTIDLSHGGDDIANGGLGDDTFLVGGALSAGDRINGGPDEGQNDTVVLNGDYSAPTTIHGVEIENIQNLRFLGGHSYNLDFDFTDTDFGNHDVKIFDASALGAGDSFTFQDETGSKPTNALTGVTITGGAGNDVIHAENLLGNSVVDLSEGGNDTVFLGFADSALFGASFNGSDQVHATAGSGAAAVLDGDYSGGLTLTSSMLSGVDNLDLTNGFTYDLTAGSSLGSIDVQSVGGGAAIGNIDFDDSAAAGALRIVAIGQTVDITGSSLGDNITVGASTSGVVSSGGGDDDVTFYDYVASDTADGGAGYDILTVEGDMSGGITITPTMMQNFEQLDIQGPSPNVTLTDGDIAAGQQMMIYIEQGQTGTVDDSAETDGSAYFVISEGGTVIGGAGNDIFDDLEIGRTGVFTGGGGADLFSLSDQNRDTLIYHGASDSTGINFDTVGAPNSVRFDMPSAVTGIDATVTSGALSTATFDTDLATAIGSSQLAAHHAVLFSPTSGDFNGDTFMIVDLNGTAGYQAGQDIVIRITDPAELALTTANFI